MLEKLTFNPPNDVFPLWSNDGSRIAFTSVRERPPQLVTARERRRKRNASRPVQARRGAFGLVARRTSAVLYAHRADDLDR